MLNIFNLNSLFFGFNLKKFLLNSYDSSLFYYFINPTFLKNINEIDDLVWENPSLFQILPEYLKSIQYFLINSSNWFFFSNLITISFLITIIVLLSICFSNTASNVKLLNIISAYYLAVYLITSSLNFDLNLLTFIENNTINNQNLTFFFNLFILIAVISTLIFFLSISNKFFIEENSKIEFSLLIWTIFISAIFLISTTDFISIIILLECIAFSSYVLVGFARKNKFSTSAALKYLILASVPSGLFILGVSLLYFNFGTFSQDYLVKIFTDMTTVPQAISYENMILTYLTTISSNASTYNEVVCNFNYWVRQQIFLGIYDTPNLYYMPRFGEMSKESPRIFEAGYIRINIFSFDDLIQVYTYYFSNYLAHFNNLLLYLKVTLISDHCATETLTRILNIKWLSSDFEPYDESDSHHLKVMFEGISTHGSIIKFFLYTIFEEFIFVQCIYQLLNALECIYLHNHVLESTLVPALVQQTENFRINYPGIYNWLHYLTIMEIEKVRQMLTHSVYLKTPDTPIMDAPVSDLERLIQNVFKFDSNNCKYTNKPQEIKIETLSPELSAYYSKFSFNELFTYLETFRLQLIYVLVKTFPTLHLYLENVKIPNHNIESLKTYLSTIYGFNSGIYRSLFSSKFNSLYGNNISLGHQNLWFKQSILIMMANLKIIYFDSTTTFYSFFKNIYYLKNISLLYQFDGFQMLHLEGNNNNYNFLIIYLALILIISNLAFKLTAAPFHLWAPSVYGSSPLATLTYLSIFSKLTIIFFSIWLFSNTFDVFNNIWEPLILTIAFLSIFFSILGAFSEKFFKRFFIYSSMGHVGFMLIGIGVLNLDGLKGTIDYLILYIISSFIIWFIIMHLNKKTMTLVNLKSLAYNYPNLSMIFSMTLFSLSGIPPLGGFFVKYEIFYSIIASSFFWFGYILLLLTVVSFFYYLRLIKIFYFENSKIFFINKNFNDLKLRLISLLFFIIPFFIFYADNSFSYIIYNILQKSIF